MHITIETNVTTSIYGNLRFTTANTILKVLLFTLISKKGVVLHNRVLNEGCDSYIPGYI